MVDEPQWLEDFMEKTDFDFSKAEDWRAFIDERREGGRGRSADGLQLRDIKNGDVPFDGVGVGGHRVSR